MNAQAFVGHRRFYRNADKAVFGGVCAGFADYFGFNLRVTRVLAVIAFFMAMPMTILIYVGTVLLVPSVSPNSSLAAADPEFRRAVRASPKQTMTDVRRRFQSLDRRLARLEKYITSSRYQLDREFRNL